MTVQIKNFNLANPKTQPKTTPATIIVSLSPLPFSSQIESAGHLLIQFSCSM